jgi:broad specificity phosphatase PhoE
MRLYIIRHAEPDYPRDALTALGHVQAQALARRLAGIGVDRVYSSPMNRALETARYTAERLGLDVQVENWTRELEDWWVPDDALGELPVWQVDATTLRAEPLITPALFSHRTPPDREKREKGKEPELGSPLPAGGRAVGEGTGVRGLGRGRSEICWPLDSFAQLCSASDDFLARNVPHQGIAVFCHSGFALTWLAHLLVIPLPLFWAAFSLAPASVTTVDFEELASGGVAPRCVGLGDVSHLQDLDSF